MLSAVNKTSLGKANIIYATLISAHTGFGIERLITKIQKTWANKGDIYLVGCTNTGKSTLFNALLGSDMCKVQASDFILRATTSPWPGTTLNMLKVIQEFEIVLTWNIHSYKYHGIVHLTRESHNHQKINMPLSLFSAPWV
ncbi:nitric oxide associated protein 1 [Halocaridina rubra]|uniref:Nitric oxide associated protein 1 n=1 Tax=Halocaridina rubra TaxID=373956 RepID=A0AAN9A4T6_HALRR